MQYSAKAIRPRCESRPSNFVANAGAAIPADSPQRSCGACLLETGLGRDEPEAEGNGDSASLPLSMGFGDYELLEQIGRGGQGVVFALVSKASIASSHSR